MLNHLRRPVLAGKTLSYMVYATIRGSVRRNDPDGISAAPYFAVNMGDTLLVSVDGAAPVTATIPASNASIDTVLAALNSALTGVGKAYEQGGTIYLQTLTAGGSGSIEVTGGSGATVLGFDVAGGPIKAVAGDILGASEGRVGNPYDATFPIFG